MRGASGLLGEPLTLLRVDRRRQVLRKRLALHVRHEAQGVLARGEDQRRAFDHQVDRVHRRPLLAEERPCPQVVPCDTQTQVRVVLRSSEHSARKQTGRHSLGRLSSSLSLTCAERADEVEHAAHEGQGGLAVILYRLHLLSV
jgi:hypothetical protein